MKKALFIGIVFIAFSLTACKKEYTCEYKDGPTYTYSNKNFSDSQIDAAKTTCGNAGGSWSTK